MPCFYNDKIYFHGQIILVSPGVWIYYRGQVVSVQPGRNACLQRWKLESQEIRTPGLNSQVQRSKKSFRNPSLKLKNIEPSVNEFDQRVIEAQSSSVLNISPKQISCFAERKENNKLNLECIDNARDRLRDIKMPCYYEDKVYPHGQIIPVSPGVWIVRDGFL